MIHSTAVVDSRAELGRDVEVGPFAYIDADVRVGDNSVIGPHASLLRYTTLGRGCRVHAGAVIGDLPQDLAFQGGRSEVRVGEGCVLREGVTIHRGTKPDTATEVGDGCFLMAFSHLAHNVVLGRRVILANGALLGGYVQVGDAAFISGNCLVHQFCRIGRLAMLGGAGGVSKDVPPFCLVPPMATNELLGLNTVGLRRAGIGADDRLALKRAYALLFRSGRNLAEALATVRAEIDSPLAREMCDFITGSRRGVCAHGGGAAETAD